jgi:hypothetical protein
MQRIVGDKTRSVGHLHAMPFLRFNPKEIAVLTKHLFLSLFKTRSDVILLVANETGEILSPDFSLALRHSVGEVSPHPS